MTTEERQAAWQAMTAKQRKAFIKSGQQLDTTSSQRQTAVAQLKRTAAGH